MCDGQPNALPNTHGTITATLIVQTSMPSIVLVAPGPTSTANLSTNSALTASTTSSSSSSRTISMPTIVTVSSTLSQTTPATTSYSAMASSESKSPVPTVNLTKPQIVGITVAAVGGGAIAIAGLILFLCWKRKRDRTRDSDMLPFQKDPYNHMLEGPRYPYGFKGSTERRGPGGTANGIAAKVPPPIPPRLDTSLPNMFSRRSIRPDTIGLAIGPEDNAPTTEKPQRHSKLLPEKPTLTLKMPPSGANQPGELQFSQPVTQPSAASRQSTATQFEEDFYDSADTAVAGEENWTSKSTDQIVDYSTGNIQTIRAVNPNPAALATFYASPREGANQWRPSNQAPTTLAASPEMYVKPLTIVPKVGNFSQPRLADAYSRPPSQIQQVPPQYRPITAWPSAQGPQPRAQPKLQLQVPPQPRPITTSSSVYSTRGSLPASDIAGPTAARHSKTRNRRSYKQPGPYGHVSSGSLTSFESNDSVISPQDQYQTQNQEREREREPRTAVTADLSPVVESPQSGKSPVSYPKIPGRLSAKTIRMVPRPRQPDFSKVFSSGMAGGGGNGGVKPWRQAEIAAAAQRQRERERVNQALERAQQGVGVGRGGRNGGHQRQGSREQPPNSQFPVPVPPLQVARRSQTFPLPQSQPITDATGGWGFNPYLNTNTNTNSNPNTSTLQLPTSRPQANQIPNPLSSHPSITFTRSSSSVSQYSAKSSSSSLLAKRRGEQKAAALNLRNGPEKEDEKKKWRVLKREEIEGARRGEWRPILGGAGGERQSGGGGNGGWQGNQFERTELPNTPGWVPKLTPTRRGDELFLSVQ